MHLRTSIIILTISTLGIRLLGQTNAPEPVVYPEGISLNYGFGYYALKDNYISPERYDGLLPYYALGWTRAHNRYVYNLKMEFGQSDDIVNYNVSTNILSYRLSQGFLYPLKPLKLFHKALGFWLGPTTDIFYCGNNPDIAISGFNYTNSFSALISLGFRSDGIFTVSEKVSIVSSLQFTLLSLGIRSVDSEEDEAQGTKPLSFASGLHASFDLGVRYDMLKWVSLGFIYRFDLTRITALENLLFSGNSAVIGIYFRF